MNSVTGHTNRKGTHYRSRELRLAAAVDVTPPSRHWSCGEELGAFAFAKAECICTRQPVLKLSVKTASQMHLEQIP